MQELRFRVTQFVGILKFFTKKELGMFTEKKNLIEFNVKDLTDKEFEEFKAEYPSRLAHANEMYAQMLKEAQSDILNQISIARLRAEKAKFLKEFRVLHKDFIAKIQPAFVDAALSLLANEEYAIAEYGIWLIPGQGSFTLVESTYGDAIIHVCAIAQYPRGISKVSGEIVKL